MDHVRGFVMIQFLNAVCRHSILASNVMNIAAFLREMVHSSIHEIE